MLSNYINIYIYIYKYINIDYCLAIIQFDDGGVVLIILYSGVLVYIVYIYIYIYIYIYVYICIYIYIYIYMSYMCVYVHW